MAHLHPSEWSIHVIWYMQIHHVSSIDALKKKDKLPPSSKILVGATTYFGLEMFVLGHEIGEDIATIPSIFSSTTWHDTFVNNNSFW